MQSYYTFSESAARRVANVVKRVENDPFFALPAPSERHVSVRPNHLFAVLCLKTGGSAGSSSTTCSFVYTVKTLRGVSIATSMTPKKRRFTNVAYTDPSSTEYEGLAYVDATGAVALYDANELPDLEAC